MEPSGSSATSEQAARFLEGAGVTGIGTAAPGGSDRLTHPSLECIRSQSEVANGLLTTATYRPIRRRRSPPTGKRPTARPDAGGPGHPIAKLLNRSQLDFSTMQRLESSPRLLPRDD